MSSEPYSPIPAPAPGTTLQSVIDAPTTTDKDGHVHLGKLTFESKGEYETFKLNQERLAQSTHGATNEQLAALSEVIDHGKIPHSAPIAPAPPGTKVDDLLKSSSPSPDKNGFYHFGQLSVAANVVDQFRAAERSLAAKDPEALGALYHLEHGAQPASIQMVNNNDFTSGRAIYWDPTKAGVDPTSGMKAPASVTLLHEQTHALGGVTGDTLAGIPSHKYENMEEQRVIEGTEARAMAKLGLTPRHSHDANLVDAPNVTSIDNLGKQHATQLTVYTGGSSHVAQPGYQQTGKIVSLDEKADTVTIATGRPPTTTYRMSDLMNDANHSDPGAMLRNAMANGDSVKIQVDRSGDIKMTDLGRSSITQAIEHTPTPGQTPAAGPTPNPVPGATPVQPAQHELQHQGHGGFGR